MFSYATGKSSRYPNYPAYGAASIATHSMQGGLQVAILNLNAELLAECGRSGRYQGAIPASVPDGRGEFLRHRQQKAHRRAT